MIFRILYKYKTMPLIFYKRLSLRQKNYVSHKIKS